MTQPLQLLSCAGRSPGLQRSSMHSRCSHLGTSTWWPKEYSIGESDMADFCRGTQDRRSLGTQVGVDGKECDTPGRVTAFDLPQRLMLAWHLNGQFQYHPDPAGRQRN